MKMTVFWAIAPYNPKVDWHFRGAYCLHHLHHSLLWWWNQYTPLKCRSASTRQHSTIHQKTIIFKHFFSSFLDVLFIRCSCWVCYCVYSNILCVCVIIWWWWWWWCCRTSLQEKEESVWKPGNRRPFGITDTESWGKGIKIWCYNTVILTKHTEISFV
jgi:hypothetical protein